MIRPRINPFGRRPVFVEQAIGAMHDVRAGLRSKKRLLKAFGLGRRKVEMLVDSLPRPPFWFSGAQRCCGVSRSKEQSS